MSSWEKNHVPKSRSSNRVGAKRWLVLLAALLAVLAVALYLRFSNRSPAYKGTEALIRAFSKQRLIEPRLSGGFPAAEFESSSDTDSVDQSELERAASLILSLENDETLEARLATARLELAHLKYQKALHILRGAVELYPHSPDALNDLGVCLIQRNRIEEALDHFNKALSIDPVMPEALFNRGLCYRRLQLNGAASADFKRALEIEKELGWAHELRNRIEEASRPIVFPSSVSPAEDHLGEAINRSDFDAIRSIVESDFDSAMGRIRLTGVIEYLESVAAGDESAALNRLTVLERIGVIVKDVKQDSIVLDLVTYLKKLDRADARVELALLYEYQRANQLLNSSVTPKSSRAAALKSMTRVARRFRERKSYGFYELAATAIADHYQRNRLYKDCIATANELVPVVERHKWPYEKAWLLNHLGFAHSRYGQDSQSLGYGRKAVELWRELGEKAYEAKSLQLISFAHGNLGDIHNAVASLRQSIDLTLSSRPRVTELAYNYLQMAEYYRLSGNHNLALLYAVDAFHYIRGAESQPQTDEDSTYLKTLAPQILSFIAIARANLGDLSEANQDIKLAFEKLALIESPRSIIAEQHVLSRAAELALRTGNHATALAYYSRTVELLADSEENKIWLIEALHRRADVLAELNEPNKAHRDLRRAIDYIELHREAISGSEQRSHFLAASQRVFDQLITLESDTGRPFEGFAASERSRARALADEMSLDLRTVKDLQRAMPEEMVVLQFAVTSNGTFIFVVTRSEFALHKSEATTELFDRLVNDYLSDLEDGVAESTLNEKAQILYDHTLHPVEEYVKRRGRLCVIPDKSLHFLPFAALVDGTGKYLIEDVSLSYAPSSTVLVACIERDRRKARLSPEKILAVGNPDFNAADFPGLKPLPHADDEAEGVAEFYGEFATILKRTHATETRVRNQMMHCEVAHLALHCLVDESSPWQAALLLAREKSSESTVAGAGLSSVASSYNPDGKMSFGEVYGMNLPRTRLVILSACQSGVGHFYRGEGVVSIVRPFLAAEVPMVVASLWQVDSKSTSELMIELHRQRKVGYKRTCDALRNAQLRLAKGNHYRHPYYWAPFIAVGSNQ